MRINLQQVSRAIILLVFVIFIVRLHYTGDILKLINPKYVMLSKTAAILFLVLFVAQIKRILESNKHDHGEHDDHDGHKHDHGNAPFTIRKFISYAIVILPLFTGFFFPMSTLDASIAANKGTMLSLSNNTSKADVSEENVTESEPESIEEGTSNEVQQDDNVADPNLYSNTISKEEHDTLIDELSERNSIEMTDQLYTTYHQEINMNADDFVGKEIKVTGFVYKEESFSANQLVLGRFIITHCVADAGVIGFLTEMDIAEELDEDTWVEAVGTIYLQEYEGDLLPAIKVTEWNVVEEPAQPYLYPISIKIT
ncbi:TIGR03943 family putative permease subunit [Paraliobacillus sediminis]|uniref:TIGR03943 family putative permease subunit n=1 Tax=Paraliobacillus sediminis TaxID=1885916 RepID=UPI000E3BCB25|nr:TIGR03943 family protein [Paraliobacillus sediminis]